ncbi:MAG: histidinol phosphatase [Actinomycetota bacterium]|nr:histidinol phosphatase [Actinomycetota bacterium]
MTADALAFAHELADAADAITMGRFRALDLRVETKPDLSPVSEADRAAEEAVRDRVRASGRGEGVLGEEFGDDGGEVKWIVDPIDGTTSYVRGVPVWATLLALQRDGVVELGLVSAPALGRRWWALRGGGAYANGERCRVSSIGRIEDCAVTTTSARRMPAGWRTIVERAWSNRGLGDFWQYCLLAEGSLDIACDSVLHVWDYAPVQIIVEEAGGRCSTFTGGRPEELGSFVATNDLLHDEAVALLGGVGGGGDGGDGAGDGAGV